MSRRTAVLAVIGLLTVGGLVFLLNAPLKPGLSANNSSAAPKSAGLDSRNVAPPPKSHDQREVDRPNPADSPPPLAAAGSTMPGVPDTGRLSAKVNLPPTDPDPSGLPPETVLENTRSVFRQYASRFGGNPVGTNPEITAALNGDNPGQVKFLDPQDGLRISQGGELIDSWGTPFFFHQLSANEMEIHSAGPDRVMWTGDDLVIK